MELQCKNVGGSAVRHIGNKVITFFLRNRQKIAAGAAFIISNFFTFGIAKRHYEKKLATAREALRRHEEKIRSGECDRRQKKELERQCRILREQVKKYAAKCGEASSDD